MKADICDREAVNKLCEEEHPDIVVNFAAESQVDRSIEDPGIFLHVSYTHLDVYKRQVPYALKFSQNQCVIVERYMACLLYTSRCV